MSEGVRNAAYLVTETPGAATVTAAQFGKSVPVTYASNRLARKVTTPSSVLLSNKTKASTSYNATSLR